MKLITFIFPAYKLLSVLSQGPVHQLTKCEKSDFKYRPSFHLMHDDDKQKFIDAVNQLRSQNHPNEYDRLIQNHIDLYYQIHGTDKFFPWHRLFIWLMEKKLQTVDPSIVIPYWDHTRFYDNLKNDPVFDSKWFGGEGNIKTNCTGGQLAKYNGYYYYKNGTYEYCIRRGPHFLQATIHNENHIQHFINKKNFTELSKEYEGMVHYEVHVTLGADFTTPLSPVDPIFFVYHAFVDKVFYDWQRKNNKLESLGFKLDNELLAPWNVNAKQLINPVDHLCVGYEEEHFGWHGHLLKPANKLNKGVFDKNINKNKKVSLPPRLHSKHIEEMYGKMDLTAFKLEEKRLEQISKEVNGKGIIYEDKIENDKKIDNLFNNLNHKEDQNKKPLQVITDGQQSNEDQNTNQLQSTPSSQQTNGDQNQFLTGNQNDNTGSKSNGSLVYPQMLLLFGISILQNFII